MPSHILSCASNNLRRLFAAVGNGIYSGEYTVADSTAYLLSLKYGGVQIGTSLDDVDMRSPYSVTVRSAGNYPPKSYALGSGLLDNADDACTNDAITSSVDRESVGAFPADIVAAIGPVGENDCVSDGAVAGVQHSFSVYSVDKVGNARTEVDIDEDQDGWQGGGGDIYEIAAIGPSGDLSSTIDGDWQDNCVPATCEGAGCAVNEARSGCDGTGCTFTAQQNCGSYNAWYTVTLAGDYSLSVTSLGRSINSSPFPVTIVPAAANAETSIVGTAAAVTTINTEVHFLITSKDEFGNLNLDVSDKILAASTSVSRSFLLHIICKH